MIVTNAELTKARHWLAEIYRDYRGEFPMRIHAREHGQHYGLGSAPPFSPEFKAFIGYLHCSNPRCKTCREDVPVYLEAEEYRAKQGNPKTRAARAFRKLRRAAPAEYDVLWLALRGHTAAEIASKLNERAIVGGHPERYDIEAVAVMTVLGTEKLSSWY